MDLSSVQGTHANTPANNSATNIVENDQEGDDFSLTDEGEEDDDDLDEDGSLILGHSTIISHAYATLPNAVIPSKPYVGAAVGAAVTPRE